MKLQRTLKLIDNTVETPIKQENLIKTIGDKEIESPKGNKESIAEILEIDPTKKYNSSNEIQETLLSNLSPDHVGRRYYDDRGPNPLNQQTVSL